MAVLKTNPQQKNLRVSHHNCCKTVGEHSQAELLDLAIEAQKSGNPLLLNCFIGLPSLDELMTSKTSAEIEAVTTANNTEAPKENQ